MKDNFKLIVVFAASLIMVLFTESGAAQSNTVPTILQQPVLLIPNYNMPNISTQVVTLSMPFGKATFIDTSNLSKLINSQIFAIHLVFSDFPKQFNLYQLNKDRLLALQQLLPNIFADSSVNIKLIRQTNGYDKATAESLFHGFVITYRPAFNKEKMEEELSIIQSFTPIKEKEAATAPTPKKPNNWDYIHGNAKPVRTYKQLPIKIIFPDREGVIKRLQPEDSIIKVSKEQMLQLQLLTATEEKVSQKTDSLYMIVGTKPPEVKVIYRKPYVKPKQIADSSIYNTFTQLQFSKALIVLDVTGSMAPYTAQFLTWLKDFDAKEKEAITAITCFNDGDDKENYKPIGATGGIYTEQYKTYWDAVRLIQKCMQNGIGGDLAENPCEAIIDGIKRFPTVNTVYLLADNWAPARDIQLLSLIKRPVNIILTGKGIGVHPHYLNMAYATGGKVFIENGVELNFNLLLNGNIANYRGVNYQLMDNKIVEIQ